MEKSIVTSLRDASLYYTLKLRYLRHGIDFRLVLPLTSPVDYVGHMTSYSPRVRSHWTRFAWWVEDRGYLAGRRQERTHITYASGHTTCELFLRPLGFQLLPTLQGYEEGK
ncbi:hypothetical protein SK128_020898, partial [Halocaridina rubra]